MSGDVLGFPSGEEKVNITGGCISETLQNICNCTEQHASRIIVSQPAIAV